MWLQHLPHLHQETLQDSVLAASFYSSSFWLHKTKRTVCTLPISKTIFAALNSIITASTETVRYFVYFVSFCHHILIIGSVRLSVPRKCAPYMGALAAAGWAWSKHGATVGSGRGWLGAVAARQAAGCNGQCASTGGFCALQFKPQKRDCGLFIWNPIISCEGWSLASKRQQNLWLLQTPAWKVLNWIAFWNEHWTCTGRTDWEIFRHQFWISEFNFRYRYIYKMNLKITHSF